ncbi:amidohydrolase [Planctomycetaceae bacterium SCGC AG-212-D15]|nr:amidohydrolase [Planctomycetaceae bacterium SCGC AG-212-D15]
MSRVIIEGRLADIDGVRHGQIVIEDGIIAAVGAGLGRADHVFNDNCLIFAGMGDIHIHAREDVTGKENYKETFATAAAAALHGGVIHVADMPNNPAAPIDEATYAAKERLVEASRLDVLFTLYAGIGPGTRPLARTVPYKAYMGPSVGDLFFTSLSQLDQTLAAYRGQSVSFHCEDPELLERHRGAATHEERRPPECELSATRFALAMIEKHALRGKLCHYSVEEGLPLIRAARARGLPVTAEVTPHHVFFDTAGLNAENRPWMQMNPPLRAPADRQAMLEALRDGTADYLATDHAPHTREEKLRGISGQPHLDTYGAFVTWLLVEQGFTPERIAAICAANPGEFVNAFHQFPSPRGGEGRVRGLGRLLPGFVGSLTVLDLKTPTTVRREDLRTKCAWSPFEGVTFPGSVAAVFVRGHATEY